MQEKIAKEWLKFFETLNESQRRWFAGAMSAEMGRGGIERMITATGLSRNTIKKGLQEVQSLKSLPVDQLRISGGGRKKVISNETKIKKDIEKILNETTSGDPMSLMKWTSKSVRKMEEQLSSIGHNISYRTIHRVLQDMGYSLQSNRKSLSRENNPNRDQQFKLINLFSCVIPLAIAGLMGNHKGIRSRGDHGVL